MSTVTDDHEYACLTSPDAKRRKMSTLTSMMEDLDLAPVAYNEQSTQQSCEALEQPIANEMQTKAIETAAKGENLFLTGRAGTGKSWTTKQIVDHFVAENKVIHVTAPTGIAAINVEGTTVNSWGGFGLGSHCKCISTFLPRI